MTLPQVAILILSALVSINGRKFQGFTEMPHPCCGMDISAKGGEIWLVGTDSNMYRFNGQNYVPVGGGCGKKIATTADGWHWVIGCDGYPYRWNPLLTLANKWERMPGGILSHISATGKNKAFASSPDGKSWLYTDGTWAEMPCCVKTVAIGENDEIWIIGTDSRLYKWNNVAKAYEIQQTGTANYIDIVRTGEMVLTATDQSVWYMDNGNWVNVPGARCTRATIDDNKMYCVSAANRIYWGTFDSSQQVTQSPTLVQQYSGQGQLTCQNFVRMPHPCCGMDISAKGGEIWLIGSDSNIYRFNGANYVPVGGGCGKKIATTADGWHWVIGCDGYPYRWNPTLAVANKWERMPGGILSHISATGKNKAFASSPDGKTWLFTDGTWAEMPCCAKTVAIGEGDEIWIIGTNSLIYQWNKVSKAYEQRPGAASNYIDLVRPGRMVISATDSSARLYNSGDWINVDGAACVRATIDDSKVYCVSADNNIWWSNCTETRRVDNTNVITDGSSTSTSSKEVVIINEKEVWKDSKEYVTDTKEYVIKEYVEITEN